MEACEIAAGFGFCLHACSWHLRHDGLLLPVGLMMDSQTGGGLPPSYLRHGVTDELVETSVIDLGVDDSVVENALDTHSSGRKEALCLLLQSDFARMTRLKGSQSTCFPCVSDRAHSSLTHGIDHMAFPSIGRWPEVLDSSIVKEFDIYFFENSKLC